MEKILEKIIIHYNFQYIWEFLEEYDQSPKSTS